MMVKLLQKPQLHMGIQPLPRTTVDDTSMCQNTQRSTKCQQKENSGCALRFHADSAASWQVGGEVSVFGQIVSLLML